MKIEKVKNGFSLASQSHSIENIQKLSKDAKPVDFKKIAKLISKLQRNPEFQKKQQMEFKKQLKFTAEYFKDCIDKGEMPYATYEDVFGKIN